MKINITKRFLLSLCLMTLTLLCGGNKAWGQAKLPISSFDDGKSKLPTGFTQKGLASDYSASPKLKFDNTGDYLIVHFDSDPSNFSCLVKQYGTGTSSNKFDIQYSTDGSTYTTFNTVTNIGNEATQTVSYDFSSLKGVRYIKWIYTKKGSGNYGLGKISIEKATSTPTFSLTEGTYNGPQHVTITAPDGYTEGIAYTTDGSDPTTSGTAKDYSDAGIDITTTTTLRAVAYDSELNFSGEATATYTIKSTDQITNSVTFDFSKPADYGYSAPAPSNGTDLEVGNTIVSGDVTITNVKNSTNTKTRFYNSSGTITFRPYTGAELSISVPAGYVITSIETQGTEGVFSLGGNTAVKGVSSWEGVSQTVVLDNITTNAKLTSMTVNYRLLSFSDTDDLTEYLPTSALADQTFILNRKVYEGWNTFCVPFALTQTQLEEAYGSGAVAKYLSDVTTGAEGVTLHFTPEEKGGIKANKAYLLYLTANVTKPKTFSGVTLQPAGDCTTTVRADNGGDYTFQGILTPTALETNDRQYFLNSAGTYFVLPLNNTSQMKATRAYIIVPAPAAPAQGRQYSFDFNGTTTAIDNVNVSGMEDGAWYTISGIRINRPAAKGVYIHNGRKVIVK